MKSLADRHADRARRIVANGSELTGFTAGSVGTAATHFRTFIESRARLSEDERNELDSQLRNIEAEVGGALSLAEAPDGSGRTMAGIGVVNPMVVPAAVDIPDALRGNGGGTSLDNVDGWGAGASPSSRVETASGSNLAGAALQDQDAGSDLGKAAAGAAAGANTGPGSGAGGTGWGGAGGSGSGGDTGPLAGDVPTLKTYLEGVNDAAEIDRLIDAEKAGKNRTTAIDALEARKAALASA